MDHAVVVRGHLTGRHIELEEPDLEDDEEDNLDETAALQIESDLASSANKGRGGPPVLHGFMVLGNREVCIATQLLGLDATHI